MFAREKLLFLLGIFISLGFTQGHWQLIGFANQNVRCIAQHPADRSIMLISIADTIYRTNDTGHTWQPVANFNGLPVNNITYHPFHCDTVFALVGAGSFSDALYRSSDTGNTWEIVDRFVYPFSMTICSFPYIILLGTIGDGIYKSEDGANTWEAMNTGLGDSSIYTLDYSYPFDTFPVFLAGTSRGLFYWSNNRWNQANGIAINARVTSISYGAYSDTGFAAVGSGSFSDGIYRSTNFGWTWLMVDNWIYSSSVLSNPRNESSVFAGDSGDGIKHSTDWGTNWSYMNQGLGNLFINCLSIHPVDTLLLFAGTQGGLYRYLFAPGIEEEKSNALNKKILFPTIISADEPIIIRWDGAQAFLSNRVKLKIYDVSGRLIEYKDLANPSKQISISPLKKSGVYFLVLSAGGVEYKDKLIIMK